MAKENRSKDGSRPVNISNVAVLPSFCKLYNAALPVSMQKQYFVFRHRIRVQNMKRVKVMLV